MPVSSSQAESMARKTNETQIGLNDIQAEPKEMYDNSTSNPFIVNCMLTQLNHILTAAEPFFWTRINEPIIVTLGVSFVPKPTMNCR